MVTQQILGEGEETQVTQAPGWTQLFRKLLPMKPMALFSKLSTFGESVVSPGLTLASRTFPPPLRPGLGSTWADITFRSSTRMGHPVPHPPKANREALLQATSLPLRWHVASGGERP